MNSLRGNHISIVAFNPNLWQTSTPKSPAKPDTSHLISYPPCLRNSAAMRRLTHPQTRSSSTTAQSHKQPRGGACFIVAK
jgi:hypothetical protein